MVTVEFASQAEAEEVILSSDSILLEGCSVSFSQFPTNADLFDKNFTLPKLKLHKVESESESAFSPFYNVKIL